MNKCFLNDPYITPFLNFQLSYCIWKITLEPLLNSTYYTVRNSLSSPELNTQYFADQCFPAL